MSLTKQEMQSLIEAANAARVNAYAPYSKYAVGAALRTRAHVKPMIISPGHRISLPTSIHYVLACSKGYRLPEPTRQADKLSKDNSFHEIL